MRCMVFSWANKIASGLHFWITERPVTKGEKIYLKCKFLKYKKSMSITVNIIPEERNK